MPTVLITGANRGLGLEFTKQYAAEGWKVLATCRDPETAEDLKSVTGDVTIIKMDVIDSLSVAAAAQSLQGTAIDVLLNNAGVMGPRDSFPELDSLEWMGVMQVNIVAPLMVSQAFVEHVALSEQKRIATVSSKMGSIGDNSGGGQYVYRSSKAGLNAALVSLAIDLAPREISVGIMHPGWVRTDMGGPDGLIDPPESIRGMRSVINTLDSETTGRFWNYDGTEIPW